MLKRLCAIALIAPVALGVAAVEPAAAAPAASSARVQRTCDDYIPRDLALDVTSAAPGQTVTITGIAYPGDTVTIRISQFGGQPIVLGTAVADENGLFSAEITIPANYPEGTYQITVSSPNCDGVSTITIVVRFPGGRCTDRRIITAQRGDEVEWELLGVLDTTKPLTVTLVPVAGGPSVVVYTGPYPAEGTVTFTVPASFANGRYRIVESGTGTNGKPLSARCGRLRVQGGGGGGTTTTTTTPGTTTTIPGTTTTTIPGGECEAYAFDANTKLIDDDGFNPKVEFTPVVPVNLGAGTWNITQATSYDSYPNRVNVTQTSEVWEIQFLDADGNVLATSAPTEDVPDRVDPGEWTGPLGNVTLPAGVVGVRGHHLPDLYEDAPFEPANSVYAVNFVICGGGGGGTTTTTEPEGTTTTTEPESTTTTTEPDGTTTTTEPEGTTTTSTSTTTSTTTTSSIPGGGGGGSTTTTSTTAAPGATTTTTTTPGGGNLVTPTTAPVAVADANVSRIGSSNPTQVAGTSTTRQSGSGLAYTGSTVRPLIALAVALIAVGALMALGVRRRREG